MTAITKQPTCPRRPETVDRALGVVDKSIRKRGRHTGWVGQGTTELGLKEAIHHRCLLGRGATQHRVTPVHIENKTRAGTGSWHKTKLTNLRGVGATEVAKRTDERECAEEGTQKQGCSDCPRGAEERESGR